MGESFAGAVPAGAQELGQAPALAGIIGRLHRALRRRVHESLPGPALPQSQVEVLRLLDQTPGLRAGEVSDTLGLAPNTASTVIQHLVQLGYVERAVDTLDRRSARLTLTEAARNRMEYWRDTRGAVLAQAVDALSAADRDLILTALPALARLADTLEAPAL
jgi:DNA-binding MarR family transcriptional regulator